MEDLTNKEPEKNKFTFKLGNFIKEKILGMYGIEEKQKNPTAKETQLSELLPHDSSKD